uniref:Band 7 domain-containing protein n=1 Tax=Oreochromis aureus TaxID=47969 RepID=A0A668VDU9_OREAU
GCRPTSSNVRNCPPVFCAAFSTSVIQEHERAIVFRLGRAIEGRAKGPGTRHSSLSSDLYLFLHIDVSSLLPAFCCHQVLTADAVPLKVDAVVFFWVVDPFMWVMRVVNGPQAMSLLAQTTLKTMIGAHTLEDVLTQKLAVAKRMEMALSLTLPVDLQRCMASEAVAIRRAGANVIAANGEVSVSHALVKAASTFEGNTVALQLRFLQSLLSMKSSARSVVVFPVPTEVSDVTVSSLP